MAERLQALQRVATDLFLDADGDRTFAQDPQAFAAQRGLPAREQKAFQRFHARLLLYRELVQGALADPLPDCFPFTYQILDAAEAWDGCVRDFIASRSIQSSYYRDINPAFVAWLVESGWGQVERPFLLQLAHFEWIELEVLRWPEAPVPAGLSRDPAPDRRVVFDGAARNLAYQWRVHESNEASPVPAEGPAHLFCFRDRELEFRTLELDPHSSAFLARAEAGSALDDAAAGAGLELPRVQDLLLRLREDGAVLGFR